MVRRGCIAAVLVAALFPAAATAQDRFTDRECRRIRSSALSRPQALDTLELVHYCPGAFGPVFARLLERPPSAVDSLLYDTIARQASHKPEPEVFAVATRLVSDSTVALHRRLSVVHLLIGYFANPLPTWRRSMPSLASNALGTPVGPGCVFVLQGERGAGKPSDRSLPDDARAIAGAVAVRLGDPSVPRALRTWASCLGAATIGDPSYSAAYSLPLGDAKFDPRQQFSVQVYCNRRVALRNTSNIPVSIRAVWGRDSLEVEADSLAEDLMLPPRRAPDPYAVRIFSVPDASARLVRVHQVLTSTGHPPYVVLAHLVPLDTLPCG
jgi:hypothetical protein